jgi:hypothetical protein
MRDRGLRATWGSVSETLVNDIPDLNLHGVFETFVTPINGGRLQTMTKTVGKGIGDFLCSLGFLLFLHTTSSRGRQSGKHGQFQRKI